MEEYFVITRVSRDDVADALGGSDEAIERAMKMTDWEMEQLARKMEDDYVNQLFWSSLEIILED